MNGTPVGSAPRTGRATILLVDDDPDLREVMRDILEANGYSTTVCPGGAEALAYLRSEGERPRVILLDLMMPGMSGWEFREAQLADPALAEIPVVVVTASRNLQNVPISAARILLKPLGVEELLAAVHPFVRG